jgi:hypothetical protein
MNEEREKQRSRAITVAFKTGRPVFADTDGMLRYTDGAKESVDTEGVDPSVPRATDAVRTARASSRMLVMSIVGAIACVLSIVGAIVCAIWAIWNPWQIVAAGIFTASAVIWRRIHRDHRET